MSKVNALIIYLKQKWFWLRGSSTDFDLQAQIYHSFSIIIIVTLLIMLPLNLLLSLNVSGLICFIAIFFQIVAFYQSRFKGRLRLAIIFSCVQSNLFLAINYFYNGGIAGPTLLISSITLFIILIVLPKQKMFTWFAINLLLSSLIVFLEYIQPLLVVNPYNNRANLFFDNLTGYIVNIILLYIGVSYIRKRYEIEKKSANDKTLILEKLNSEKNKLFSIVSHDLKTPLASVQQYLVMLNQMDLAADERKWIEANLLKTTTNTLELLSNLLQWCKTQMDGNDVNLQPINLKSTFVNVLEIVTTVAKSKNIKINNSIANDVFIIADFDMLQLIIRNLLHNAVKFTQNNGNIHIAAKKADNYCIISITDNGVGMDYEAKKEAFSLKIKSTYGTQNETGTGLGLVLCKEYTELQNGKIWFTSQKNVGTVFNLQFPLQ